MRKKILEKRINLALSLLIPQDAVMRVSYHSHQMDQIADMTPVYIF